MIAIRSVLLATLWAALVLARVSPFQSRSQRDVLASYQMHLDDVPVKLNTSARVSTSAASKPAIPLHEDFNWGIPECLIPADRPIASDCDELCNMINGVDGPVTIQPLSIEFYELGHCAFGIANLDPCNPLRFDHLSELYERCETIYLQCVRFRGEDGYIEGTDPGIAVALYGTPAAPPYQSNPCA